MSIIFQSPDGCWWTRRGTRWRWVGGRRRRKEKEEKEEEEEEEEEEEKEEEKGWSRPYLFYRM